MSASRKFDLSSDSPDRPLYGSGHHGSYGAASLDRSGSFRENIETPLLSSLPNMSRSCSAVTQGDVHSFFQCVRFDPKSMVAEHKLNKPPEFKRLASAAVSIPPPDSLHASSKSKHVPSSSMEDLRRLKAGVRESGTKARERVKILNDCLSVINKFFPAIPSRKRSSTMLPIQRTTVGMGLSKMVIQNHVSSSGIELERCEERIKNPNPNKRPRTSIIDSKIDSQVRSPGRPSGTLIRRVVGRLPNTGLVQGEDHTLSIGVNGWDKSKMKKRRTGIKPDIPDSSVATKPTDGYRESKQGMQPRVPIDSHSRLPDSHFSRSAIVNGRSSMAKLEASAQATSGMHSAICSTDSENSSLYERRDHTGGHEKGRAKTPNKENSREDFSSGSPTTVKLSANVRAPRSGSSGVSKLSQVVPRSPSSNNWELNNCTSKSPGAFAATNRKRTPVRSPSPPVTNWVQKPQKISRTPRRTNLSPNIPGFDENPTPATTSKLMVTPPDSPQLFKTKSNYLSPGALSESEELHDAEVMFREKSIMCDDMDEKSGHNVQKLSALMIPPKNNKAVSRGHGDGVKRQGRTGRGFPSSRSVSPLTIQKLGVLGTTKQIRSARPGLEKSERVGRPPTRKLSDRKPYGRQKQTATNMAADLSAVGSNDGHEELLAAAHAVTNTAQALSSPLWKDVEPVFRFISDKDISYLTHQIDVDSPLNTLAPALPEIDSSSLAPHGRKMNDHGREGSETLSVELSPEDISHSAKAEFEISLCQRLMAALIPEDGNLELFSPGKEDNYDMYDSRFEIEKDMEADTFCFEVSQRCNMSGYPSSNGYGVNSNGKSFHELGRPKQDTNIVSVPDTVTLSYENLENGAIEDHVMPVTTSSDYQYRNMSLNERLLVELNSIGIFPNLESADELNGIISGFEEKLQEKVSMKKSFLSKLLSPSFEAKEFQEREFEGRALDKLCGMANEKYMSCWGPYAQGMKSSTGKMAKQAALSMVKRTVHRCREFEGAGKSCFGGPLYKDVFLSGVLRLSDAQSLNSTTDNEVGKLHRSTSRSSMEMRTSDTQASPSNTHKEDSWSDRVKKRELLLDDIGGMMSGALLCNAKGKRSERDREVNGNIKEFSSTKIKGKRKYKTKPKKISLLSTTINVPVGKMLEQPKATVSPKFKSRDNNNNICGSDINEHKNESTMEILEDPIDLSGLQLPGMEDFGGPDDLGGQGGDIDSWLNIEDDELHDHDFMGGLGIPMDDLSGLDMLV